MRLAVVQSNPILGDTYRNARTIVRSIKRAAQEGCQLVVFPECALTGYCVQNLEQARRTAILLSSAEMEDIRIACCDEGIFTIVGFAENENGFLYNSAAIFGPEGLCGIYRKSHIPCLGYDRYATAGNELPIFDLPFGKIGVLICFDIRFPEAARVMCLRGADLICVPTNWPFAASKSSDIVCPARAIENRCFIAAANRVGEENGFQFCGRSKIIDEEGNILASADHTQEDFILADIELNKARNKRVVRIPGEYEMDLAKGRRPDLYGDIVKN